MTKGSLPPAPAADAAQRDAGGDERDHLAAGDHRHDRAQRRARACRWPPRSACRRRAPADRAEVRPPISAGSRWVSRMPSGVMIVTKSIGVSSMIRSAMGCSAAVAAASDPPVTAAATAGISAIVRATASVTASASARSVACACHASSATSTAVMTTTAARKATKTRDAALAPRPRHVASSRAVVETNTTATRPHPPIVGPEYSQGGRRDRRPAEQRSFDPLGGDDGSFDPRTGSFKLPGYNWRRGKTAWDKHTWLYVSVIIAVVLGADDRPHLARASASRSSRSARGSSPSSR